MNKKDYGIKYKLISSETVIENETITTYGIRGNTIELPDVSTEKAEVLAIIHDINNAQLEECHLLEYIEDCLI